MRNTLRKYGMSVGRGSQVEGRAVMEGEALEDLTCFCAEVPWFPMARKMNSL